LSAFDTVNMKFRRKHSAIESNINELEHRGWCVLSVRKTGILSYLRRYF
jgi:hypothetical protein